MKEIILELEGNKYDIKYSIESKDGDRVLNIESELFKYPFAVIETLENTIQLPADNSDGDYATKIMICQAACLHFGFGSDAQCP